MEKKIISKLIPGPPKKVTVPLVYSKEELRVKKIHDEAEKLGKQWRFKITTITEEDLTSNFYAGPDLPPSSSSSLSGGS